MGLADTFGSEDRTQVKYSDFYRLVKEAAKAELIEELILSEPDTCVAGQTIRRLIDWRNERHD